MANWKDVLITQESVVQQAVELLEETSLGILLVVDNENRLVGTITDGDIRRALIRGIQMSTPITQVVNPNPVTVNQGYPQDKSLKLMKDGGVLHIPVLDSIGKVVGLETLEQLVQPDSLDNPVVLMAGGFGTRLRPLTDSTPKPLLEIGGRPLLEIIIKQFSEYGFRHFFISTHYKAEQVRDYFGCGEKWGISIDYIHETEPLGTAGVLRLLPGDIGYQPVFLMNGDILSNVNFKEMLQFHRLSGGDCTIAVRQFETRVPYGVVEIDGTRVKNIIEKPSYSNFVNAGIYILNRSMLEIGESPEYMDMPNYLMGRINSGAKVNVYPIHEYWLDIGQTTDYLRAQYEVERLVGLEPSNQAISDTDF